MTDSTHGTKATIDGLPILNVTAVSWKLTSGTTPYETSVVVATKAIKGDDLIGKDTSLVVTGAKDSFTAACYIIGQMAGPHPQMTTLTICDKRWLWGRKHYTRRFNVRRKTGDRRMLTEGISERMTFVVDDYFYEKATLKGGASIWTAKDAMMDVLSYVDGGAPDIGGVNFRDVPFENVDASAPGDEAIDRIRHLTSGINVYIALDGTTTLIDETDSASASRILGTFGAPVVGKGIASFVNRAGIRPQWIDVLLPVECELKFTSIDEGNTYSLRGDTRKLIENVVPIPDASLTVNGKTISRGTYITVDDAFTAWGTPILKGGDIPAMAMSHDVVQKFWMGGFDRLFTDCGLLSGVDADWAARVRAIKQHYRTTYRISQYWMARIKYLLASRAAIIDRENGTRAPAYVTSDYSYSPNARGRYNDPANSFLWVNVTDAYSDDLKSSKPVPCLLSIVDGQLGIVHLDFQTDTHGLWDAVLPCAIGNPPGFDFRKGGKTPVITGDVTYGSVANAPYLAPNHHMAFVLTAAPSAPNNNGQMLRIRVTSKDAEKAGVHVGRCTGPGMEIRVGLGTGSGALARFMWSDKAESSIDRMFGRDVSSDTPFGDYAPADSLVAGGLLSDQNECEQIAHAVAASVYSSMTDRVIGTQAMRLGRATLVPTGNLVEVEFSLDGQGALNATGSFNPSSGRIDVTSLLSSEVRRKLFGLVQ